MSLMGFLLGARFWAYGARRSAWCVIILLRKMGHTFTLRMPTLPANTVLTIRHKTSTSPIGNRIYLFKTSANVDWWNWSNWWNLPGWRRWSSDELVQIVLIRNIQFNSDSFLFVVRWIRLTYTFELLWRSVWKRTID